ncbi:MAG TPA: molybdate ABC transporter substrate-binding protein [Bacillota bacterium]
MGNPLEHRIRLRTHRMLALLAAACAPALLAACLTLPGPAANPPAAPGERSPRESPAEIRVFAAASLTDAFTAIARRFEAAHPGTRVALNFGASSTLRTQLEQGARADVFAPADRAQMDKARAAGLIDGAPVVFAHNRLAVIVPKGNPAGLRGLRDLARSGLRLITAAPGVPIAEYTRQMLAKLAGDDYGPDFADRVLANAVSQEPNVRQVVFKVAMGEADAAIVYASDITPDVADRLEVLSIPDRYNVTASYPIAVVRQAPNPRGARAFVAFVQGPEAQAILQQWGFIPVGSAPR